MNILTTFSFSITDSATWMADSHSRIAFWVWESSSAPATLSPPALSSATLSPPALLPPALAQPALAPPASSSATLSPPALAPPALSSATLSPPALSPPTLSSSKELDNLFFDERSAEEALDFGREEEDPVTAEEDPDIDTDEGAEEDDDVTVDDDPDLDTDEGPEEDDDGLGFDEEEEIVFLLGVEDEDLDPDTVVDWDFFVALVAGKKRNK